LSGESDSELNVKTIKQLKIDELNLENEWLLFLKDKKMKGTPAIKNKKPKNLHKSKAQVRAVRNI
jgi:hypothetical protein